MQMVKLRRSGLEALKLTLNCILESHAGSVASVGERNWKGTYTSYAMFSMDIILALPGRVGGDWDVERGRCSLFKGEDIRITTDGLQQFRQVSFRPVGLRSPPVGNWGLSDGSPEPVLRRTNGGRGQRSSTHRVHPPLRIGCHIEAHRGVYICSLETVPSPRDLPAKEVPHVEIFTTGRDLAAMASLGVDRRRQPHIRLPSLP